MVAKLPPGKDGKPKELKIYLRADATTTYGDVKRVMAACAAKGQNKILFASYIKEN